MTRRFATSRDSMPIYPDGLCTNYTLDEAGNRTDKMVGLNFQDRVLGFKRYFTAQAIQVKIDRIIRIPHIIGIDNHDRVEIIDVGTFEIQMAQTIFDSNPASIDLTLKQLEIFDGNSS